MTKTDSGQVAVHSPPAEDTAVVPPVSLTPGLNLVQCKEMSSISIPGAPAGFQVSRQNDSTRAAYLHSSLTGRPRGLRQWFPNFPAHLNHMEGLVNNSLLGSTPRVSDSVNAMD